MTTTTEPLYLDEPMPDGWELQTNASFDPNSRGWVGMGYISERKPADVSEVKRKRMNYRIRNPRTNDTRPVVFSPRPVPAKAETCGVEWCGRNYGHGDVPSCREANDAGIQLVTANGNLSEPAYCSPACADRAAGRAAPSDCPAPCVNGSRGCAGADMPWPCAKCIVKAAKPVDPRAARREECSGRVDYQCTGDAVLRVLASDMAPVPLCDECYLIRESRIGDGPFGKGVAQLPGIERTGPRRGRTAPYVSPRRDASVGCQLDSALDHEGKDVR